MRVLAIFCAAFAAGVALSQYLPPTRWALILCGVFLASAFIMGLCGCANKRGDWAKRVFLCALGLAFAFGYNTLYAHFIKAPNDALLGTQDTVEAELLGYAEETNHGAKVTVKILNRGLPGRAIYYGDAELMDLEPGAHVTAEALFNSATDPTGKGLHLRNFTAKGVYILLYQRGDPTYDDANVGTLKYLPQRIAKMFGEIIEHSYGEREGAFLRALLLGDKRYLDEEDASNLSEAGLSHIMAVSGLHCCFLASLIGSLMGDKRKKLRCAVTLPLIFLYAFVTGLTPSILRACIMISMGMIAPLLGRDNDPPTSISFALLLILLKNPFAIASISLQLSFSAVSGIIWLTPKLTKRAHGRHKLVRAVILSFSTTLGAMVFSTPLACYYFGTFSVVSLLSNLLCLWLVSVVFAFGLVSVLLIMLFPQFGTVCAFVPSLGIRAVLAIAGLLEELPFHAVYFNTAFSIAWLIYVYAIFAVCALFQHGRYRYWTALGLTFISLFAAARVGAMRYERAGSLSMVALDVGQGESVLLISEGRAALVDCGSRNTYIDAGDIAADYLHSAGCDTLDAMVLTHYHSDHANGLAALLARIDVGTLYLPDIHDAEEEDGREIVEALAGRYGVEIRYITQLEEIENGASTLHIYPPLGEEGANELGLSVLCSLGNFDVLITGDMDAETEAKLVGTYAFPDIEVLVVGHHGSKYSTGTTLLEAVTPEVGVISVGDNSYGHPTEETLLRLADAGMTVYRTDLQGNILITVDRED